MVQRTSETLSDLYLADETAWLDAMAGLIRAGRLGDVDYPHLAEYLEDMAIRDRREVNSRLRVFLAHVLKWIYQKEMRTPSWETTVNSQQGDLEDLLESGVLRNHAEETLAATYARAVKQAVRETKLPAETFPPECPWTIEQLISAELLTE
jgi:Domain of unknown function DUF29